MEPDCAPLHLRPGQEGEDAATWGCKPEPQKIPSSQIRPRRDRIQVYDLRAAAKGVCCGRARARRRLHRLRRSRRDYLNSKNGDDNFPYNLCFRASNLSRRQAQLAFQVYDGACAKHRFRESRSPWTRPRRNPGSRPQALDRIFWGSGLHPLRARPQHAARTAAVCASKLGPRRHAEAQRLPWRPLYEDLAQIVAMVRSRTRAAAGPALVCRASRRLNCPTDRQIIPYTHECCVFYEKVRAI